MVIFYPSTDVMPASSEESKVHWASVTLQPSSQSILLDAQAIS